MCLCAGVRADRCGLCGGYHAIMPSPVRCLSVQVFVQTGVAFVAVIMPSPVRCLSVQVFVQTGVAFVAVIMQSSPHL